MSRVIVHRSEWFDTSQSENKRQGKRSKKEQGKRKKARGNPVKHLVLPVPFTFSF
jgi:hypothetical protein